MSSKMKIFSVLIGTVFLLTVFGQACSDSSSSIGGGGGGQIDHSSSKLTLSPATAVLAPSQKLKFQATGGAAPVTCSVTGGGSLDADNEFTAPDAIATSRQTSLIACADARGSQATASVSVIVNTLTVNHLPTQPAPGNVIVLSAQDGQPPYSFTRLSGSGALIDYIYAAPATPETAVIYVQDAGGKASIIQIPIGN